MESAIRRNGFRSWHASVLRSVLVVLVFSNLWNSTLFAQEPTASRDVTAAFRQFLRNDLDAIGKLIALRDEQAQRPAFDPYNQEKNAYAQKLVVALTQQIAAATRDAKSKADELQVLLSTAPLEDYAQVLRLPEWDVPAPEFHAQLALEQCLHGWRQRLSVAMQRKALEIVASGSREEKIALCQLLEKEASSDLCARPLSGSYRATLRSMLPAIIELSKTPNPNDHLIRPAAAAALARLHASPEEQVNAFRLILSLDGSTVGSRQAGYRALGMPFTASAQLLVDGASEGLLDRHAPLALPLLVAGLRDNDATVRHHSIQACKDISSLILEVLKPAPATQALALNEGQAARAYLDIKKLQTLEAAFISYWPALTEAASDPDQFVRVQAISLLNDLTELRNRLGAWQVCFALESPARADNSDLRLVSFIPDEKRQLTDLYLPFEDKLTPALRATLAVLKTDLVHPDRSTRLAALEVLETMNQTAVEASDELVLALRDHDLFVRWAAVRVLTHLGPLDPAKILPCLIPLIGDERDSDMAKPLATLLSQYGPAAAPAVPALIKTIEPSTGLAEESRIAYLQTLATIGPKARNAIPTIVKLLEPINASRNSQTAVWATAFKPSEPVLYENVRVRVAATKCLASFGESAKGTIPVLLVTVNDLNPEVRKAAGEALLCVEGR